MGQASNEKMTSIPLHRVAVVRPFTQFLENIGASVERGFRLAGLPFSALESVDNFIPSHRFWSFLVNMSYSQGIEDLGFRVGQQFGANCPDPHLTNLLQKSPTLYQGLLKASELTNRTVSHCQVGIHQPLSCNYSLFYHRPSCDAKNPAIEQIGWYGLMSLIGMVREFAGPQWQPAEIGIMTHCPPCGFIREQFPHARIRLQQPYSFILLGNPLLSLPPLTSEASTPASSSFHYPTLTDDFIGSLEQIILAYIQEPDLSIEFIAEVCNASKRSLQRKLTKVGTHYSEVRTRVRFQAACQMLHNRGIKITDIAHKLGYDDASHFSRAFRQIAGVSPREYRQSYTH